ncbi:MAG: PIN domain-containing protein [Proteobacteria bacterium]|nr:PIN domain-containing protein [Pseudomonadota bacterium]
MELIERVGGGPVALDSAIFIYFIEDDERRAPLIASLLQRIDQGQLGAVTSAVTLLECLVVPYRDGDLALAERYEALLTRSRGLTLIDFDRPLLRAAAQLRAALGLKTPDALQLAAALRTGAKAFLTNDRRLPPVAGLAMLQLDDFLPPSAGQHASGAPRATKKRARPR